MPYRRQRTLMFASSRRAKFTNSPRSDMGVDSFQGMGPPCLLADKKCYPCPRTPVTHVSGLYTARERATASFDRLGMALGGRGGATAGVGGRRRRATLARTHLKVRPYG